MHVCTIIAKNYVAHARVLARSLRAVDPGSRLWVLIIDDFTRHLDPADEPFEVLTPEQVGCDPFEEMALRYSVLELSTAVKPWLLRHLMTETSGPVTYLDPDIQVFAPLTRLDELARAHGVVLTPHNRTPIPQDGRAPSQVDIMIAGIYNLGYVSLAPRDEVEHLLDWWSERLRRDSRVDPLWGYFVDQRWFDLAPGFLSDLAIVREPEFNVAYWNLHERRLEADGDGYTVNGRPLAFFHFSGFDPQRPLILSRHQTRIDVTQSAALERILAGYAAALFAAGHADSRHWPYDYATLGDGTPLDADLRELGVEFAGDRPPGTASPFTLEGAAAFDRWLAQTDPAGPPGISRALTRVYAQRDELRGAFPDIAGGDREGLLAWAADSGAAHEPLLARVYGTRRPAATPPELPLTSALRPQPNPGRPPLRDGPWGVNVIGRAETESVAGLLEALDRAGIRALPVDPREPEQALLPVNLICVGPGELPGVVGRLDPEQLAGRYTVGLAPQPSDALGRLDEVWVPTAAAAAALGDHPPEPVHVVGLPPGTAPERAAPELARRLEAIRATGVAREAPDPARTRPASLGRLALRLAQGPPPAAPGTGQVARERLRRAVLAVIQPFTKYQEAVNRELVGALADLQRELDRERLQAAAERADRLALARRCARLESDLGALREQGPELH